MRDRTRRVGRYRNSKQKHPRAGLVGKRVHRMRALLILVAVIALPFAEIALVVWLVHHFGWGPVLISGAPSSASGSLWFRRASQKWSQLAREAQVDPASCRRHCPATWVTPVCFSLGGLLLILPGTSPGRSALVFRVSAHPPPDWSILRWQGLGDGQPTGLQASHDHRGETVAGPSGIAARSALPGYVTGYVAGPVIISGEIVAGPE